MNTPAALAILALVTVSSTTTAADNKDPLCAPLRSFVASVGPDELRELTFHTSWGSNFKGAQVEAIFAKRCLHHGYGPAEAPCRVLMERGAVEFSNTNAERALVCLAPRTRFGKTLSLEQGSFSLRYGREERGSFVTVSYGEDPEMGGMVLRVAADGY